MFVRQINSCHKRFEDVQEISSKPLWL